MAKSDDPGAQHVAELLAERKKLEQWLAKLDATADEAKKKVAEKVRSDYAARLEEITDELTQYGDGLRKQRDTHAKSLAGLQKQEAAREEEMAEAELRHEVGEYTEAAWKDKKAGITGKLETIRTSIAEAEAAIATLDEVLEALAGRDEAEPEPEPEPEPAPPPKAAKKKKQESQTELTDELAFLKSVSEDEKGGPSPARASGAIRQPEEAETETPAPVEKESGEAVVGKSRPSVVNQRTLECRECGSLNLPTEWYCEKCGAELAAM